MIVIGLLAHNKPECLADTVASIRRYVNDPAIVLFNGGSDDRLIGVAKKLGMEYCRYSRRLYHGKLIDFPIGVMRHLRDEGCRYDYLVTLDSDMLVVRDGFEEFLHREMVSSGYMGTNFHLLNSGEFHKWEIGRYFLRHWREWQSLFGDVRPAGCFNPGQVFREDFVDRLLDFPMLNAILDKARGSRLPALEEVIYATLAVALDANPTTNPGSNAISLHIYDSRHLSTFLKDPSIFLIHKVQMDVNSPDRMFLRAVRDGCIPLDFLVDHNHIKHNSVSTRARQIAKEVYYSWLVTI